MANHTGEPMEDTCNSCGRSGTTGETCPQCLKPTTCPTCRGAGVVLIPVRLGEPKLTHRQYQIINRIRQHD